MSYHSGGRNNYRGNHNNHGRGRGRHNNNKHHGGRGRGGNDRRGLLNPCRDFIQNRCTRGNSCAHAHIFQLHKQVKAAPLPKYGSNNQYHNNRNNHNNTAAVTSMAIWEKPNQPFQIFTGSSDGYWRLWTSDNASFETQFQHCMNGSVSKVVVLQNFMFCAFEAICPAVPHVPVGMCHAWNLDQSQQPPLELQAQPAMLPYAHNNIVSALDICLNQQQVPQIATGSRDGAIRVWKFENGGFVLAQTMLGHAREVTGLILLPDNSLWSGGIDRTVRVWNTVDGTCKSLLHDHTDAVTALVRYSGPQGNFILSSSLDKTVKVWDVGSGAGVKSETHGEGIVSMCVAKDTKNQQVLLLGMESGAIQCHSLDPTQAVPNSFTLLFAIVQDWLHVGHTSAVNCLAAGPSATFFSGGADGNMLVFSFTGDLAPK